MKLPYLTARREWNRHRRNSSNSNIDMWQWGWMQGEGKLNIPGLGPCIGVKVYDPGKQLAIGGHFPVRGNLPDSSDRHLPEMLRQAKRRTQLDKIQVWIGGGLLWSEKPDEDTIFSLERRLRSNAETRAHRDWVQATVAKLLGPVATVVEFGASPICGMDHTVDVATGDSATIYQVHTPKVPVTGLQPEAQPEPLRQFEYGLV
ncbi:MAG TPA: hypothetical protein VLF40_00275 [Candidatus Saccharimonadales bacterium]|nr:hypothetical protein [Candidatus Saccharimonadales bacterium]